MIFYFTTDLDLQKILDYHFLYLVANSSGTNSSTLSTTIKTTTVSEVTTGGGDTGQSSKVLVPIYNASAPLDSGFIKQEISLQVKI